MTENAGASRRRGRPAASEARLNRARIVEEAQRLVSLHGFDKLSIRRLAAALGVDPMAIYHHLHSKEAVIEAVVEGAFMSMALPDPGAGWRARVAAWAKAYCDLAADYPGLVLRVPQSAAAVDTAMKVVSAPLVDAFADAGLAAQEAETASGVLVDFLNGFLLAGPASERPLPAALQAHLDAGIRLVCEGALAGGARSGRVD